MQELAITGVEIITGRLETLIAERAETLRCDGFTSRATIKLGPTLALAATIVRPGGHAILWKGSSLQDELAASAATWERDWEAPAVHEIANGPNSISVFQRKS